MHQGAYWMGGWVVPRNRPENLKKEKILPLMGLDFRYLGLPVCSQSLYILCYPRSFVSYELYELCLNNEYSLNTELKHNTKDFIYANSLL
jgi:hypothetical protein